MGLADHPGFMRFWAATTVSDVGTYITTLALQILIVVTLHGTAADVGWVSAARWLPYVLMGLVAGTLVDRWDRRRTLVVTDVVRGLLLVAVGGLGAAGRLSIPTLIVLIAAFGLLSLFNDVAYQSFVPLLVPRSALTQANARLEQSAAVAQTTGPALAGAIIAWIGAPFAMIVDAVSHLIAGAVMATIPTARPAPSTTGNSRRPGWRTEIADGLRWVYRHPLLGPLAITDHGWFLFNAMLGTVFVVYAIDGLGFTPFVLGVTLACAGVGAVVGSLLSTRAGRRFGYGPVMAVSRAAYAPACLAFALVPGPGAAGDGYRWLSVIVVGAGQLLYGLSIGFEGPLEMGFRQTVTPNRLQGRMNATMRSTNRAMIVVGAPLSGLLVALVGYRITIWISSAGFVVVAVAFGLSRMGRARQPEHAVD